MYTEFPLASKLARRVLQLLATKTLVMKGVPRLLLLESEVTAPRLQRIRWFSSAGTRL